MPRAVVEIRGSGAHRLRELEALGASRLFLILIRSLYDVANEMDTEDGVIWVYGLDNDGVMAFTDFGIENLVELIKIHKDQKPREERRDLV
ncbi:MAG: hypothetical protein WBQ53_09115 [Methylocystis sp.]